MQGLSDLQETLKSRLSQVDDWIAKREENLPLPFYASVDMRNSGWKMAAIDTNLFPAGFNNILPRDLQQTAARLPKYIEKRFGGNGKIRKVLIIPEEFTRNSAYLENVFHLQNLFALAGFEVRLGTLSEEIRKDRMEIELPKALPLVLHRTFQEKGRLKITDFDPDLVILNNDLSQEPPAAIRGVSQPILPPIEIGWHNRRKSRHFEILHRLVGEFCDMLGFDPWLLHAETELVTGVDVQEADSRKRLQQSAIEVLERLRKHYQEHGIKQEPYVFLKDNSGTYGIAVASIQNTDEILDMNSKMRKKMSSAKGKAKVTEILVQEGIPTMLLSDGTCPAEPVIYLVAGDITGGFYRKHCGKNELESLNTKGMVFVPFSFQDGEAEHRKKFNDGFLPLYHALGRLDYLAAALEIRELTA